MHAGSRHDTLDERTIRSLECYVTGKRAGRADSPTHLIPIQRPDGGGFDGDDRWCGERGLSRTICPRELRRNDCGFTGRQRSAAVERFEMREAEKEYEGGDRRGTRDQSEKADIFFEQLALGAQDQKRLIDE